jgi:hypothetical protein
MTLSKFFIKAITAYKHIKGFINRMNEYKELAEQVNR